MEIRFADEAREPFFGEAEPGAGPSRHLTRTCIPQVEAAGAHVQALRQSGRKATVRELLGGEIAAVVITYFDPRYHTAETAAADVGAWLRSVVVDPAHPYAGPSRSLPWSEPTALGVRGVVSWKLPPVRWDPGLGCLGGRFDLDPGLHHFLARDLYGVFWWHRWDALWEREETTAPSTAPPNP